MACYRFAEQATKFLLRAAPFSAADASAVSNKVIDPSDANTMVRVNKGISILCGISRREAEKYIVDKKVSVNGQLLTNLSSKLNLDEDIVMVNGKEMKFQKKSMMQSRIWLCHKLKGELVTTNDPQSRLTIYDRFKSMNIPDHSQHLLYRDNGRWLEFPPFPTQCLRAINEHRTAQHR